MANTSYDARYDINEKERSATMRIKRWLSQGGNRETKKKSKETTKKHNNNGHLLLQD
jgi:hypothetical protein